MFNEKFLLTKAAKALEIAHQLVEAYTFEKVD